MSMTSMSGCVLASPAIGRLTQRRPMITLVETYDAGNRAMTLSIDDFRQALDIIGDSAGAEAAIVAQFALDLAVTAQFRSEAAASMPKTRGDFSTCALRATVRRNTRRAVRSTRRVSPERRCTTR